MIVRPVLCKSFVGRREELAFLRERRLDAGASRGSLVLVSGEAGVGKSRLIAEFCATLTYSRWRIGTGSCLEFASRPYGPLLDVLERIDSKPFDFTAAATKHEQFDAIVVRITAISAKTATVIALEDIHWADAATLDFLAYFGTKVPSMRVLVIASYRTQDLHPDDAATLAVERIVRAARAGRIDLRPLRGVELRAFIDDALADVTLPDETRRAIAIAGDGNPFFTEELLKSAAESAATQSEERVRRDLPATVRATLLQRLRPFDDDERHVVTQAAVIGRTFALPLLATTLDTEPASLLPTLRRARDYQLIEELTPTTFRFRHGLTREAIYGTFLSAEIEPRHRAIAVALEDEPPERRSIESLAYHWWAAGDGKRGARYNEMAGDEAANVHAHDDAIAFYERGLDAKGLPFVTRGALTEKIAERRIALGMTIEAHRMFSRAAQFYRHGNADDREATCRVMEGLCAYTLVLPEPTVQLEAMLERLDADAYMARSHVHLGLAWLTSSNWFPTQAAFHLASVDPRVLTEGSQANLRYHNVSAWVAMTLGDVTMFRSEHARWIEAATLIGSLRAIAAAHYNGASCYAFFGKHEEAATHIERARAITVEARLLQGQSQTREVAATAALLRGDIAGARAEVEAFPMTAENRVTLQAMSGCAIRIAMYLDDREMLATWFDGFETDEMSSPELESSGPFAEMMVRRGRERDARHLLERAMPDCELPRNGFESLLVAGRYGSPSVRARARAYLARAAEGPRVSAESHALALFDARIAREAGREDEAIALARSAAEGFRQLRFPLLEAEACEEAGDVAEALAIWRRCGATACVRRLEDVWDAARGAPPPTVSSAAAALLSAREREIAMLAIQGRSNMEIARELSITHKTVEKHLGSAYQKLGVSSRVQLAGFLGR